MAGYMLNIMEDGKLNWWNMQSPGSKVFGAITGFRFGIALFVGGTLFQSNAIYRPWPVVGFLFLYTTALLLVWRFRRTSETLKTLQIIAFMIDIFMALLILMQFSPTWQTGAPALLPLVAFEGWGYWGPMGALAGWLSVLVMLMGTRFYQVVTHGRRFPMALMFFWTVTVSIVIALPVVVSWLQRVPTTSQDSSLPTSPLTPREHEIYELLRKNCTVSEIARLCHIEPGTVKSHIHSIYRKLGVQRREDLVADLPDGTNL